MKWLDSITDWMDRNLSKLWEIVKDLWRMGEGWLKRVIKNNSWIYGLSNSVNYSAILETCKIKERTDLEEFEEFIFDLFKYEVLYAIWVEVQILQLNKPWKDIWVKDKNVLIVSIWVYEKR